MNRVALPAIVLALNERGLRCKAAGRYAEGRGSYERALVLATQAADPDPDAIATLYHNLGGIEHACGNYAVGEALARRGLALRRRACRGDTLAEAADLIALAALVQPQARLTEAEALYREALELLDPMRNDHIAEIGVALNGLGVLYVGRGLEEGVALLERAAELRRRSAGPGLELTLNNLAIARRWFGRGSIAAVFPKRNRPDDCPGASV